MKKIIKYILIILIIALVVMQFIRPDKNEGGYESLAAFKTETNVPEEVFEILKTNCFDCHSNQTVYPWYAEISPLSYWFKDHIDEGKDELNFSEWKSYSVKKKDHKLEELVEEVEEGEMPLDSYTWIHAKLSKKDRKTLIVWANLARLPYQLELEKLRK
ncbi:MAG: heme-binding domain-containing protein [Flavobacteriaceae bacterium]|nr:heme-binding domain-containing protein [Flavobacteriaceae bacterium]